MFEIVHDIWKDYFVPKARDTETACNKWII